MKKRFSARLAGSLLLVALGLLFLFHILVLLKVLPAEIVWGGRIGDSRGNLVFLEIVALVVTSLFIFLVAVKTGYIHWSRSAALINAGIWLIFGFLVLNTLGNLASAVSFENLAFAPLTLLLALCALRLALEK